MKDDIVIYNERDYKCNICNSTFSGHSIEFEKIPDYIVSLKGIDADEKYPQCPNCGAMFFSGLEEVHEIVA